MRQRPAYPLLILIFFTACALHVGMIFLFSSQEISKRTLKIPALTQASLDQELQEHKKRQRDITQALEQLLIKKKEQPIIFDEAKEHFPKQELQLQENIYILDIPNQTANTLASEQLLEQDLDIMCIEQDLLEFDHTTFITFEEESLFSQFLGNDMLEQEKELEEEQFLIGNPSLNLDYMPSFSFPLPAAKDLGTYGQIAHLDPIGFSSPCGSEQVQLPPQGVYFEEYTIDGLGNIPSSQDFDLVVEYFPKRLSPGFIVKTVFTPKKEALFKRIRQNLYFLIDRSNSISKVRYELSKQAVAACLNTLTSEDTFNILVFDDKFVRMSTQSLLANKENIQLGKEFLSKQGHGGHFSTTDIYASLGKIVPKQVPDQEVNVAILLSDGDTYLSIEQQRQMIGRFTQENHGKVSLFCLASGEGNNLAMLELLSTFNKGSLIYATTYDQIEPKLMQLLRSLHTPIGKSMVATAIGSNEKTHISLYPRTLRMPNLYEHRSFVIYGSINRLEDFTLFIQGKYYDKEFDIKKNISFENSSMGTLSLERQWTLFQAQDHLENFFIEGNQTHLEKARQLLAPLNIAVPFLTKID